IGRNNMEQDWPNLKRYADENQTLGLPQANEKRVIFMGDSITEEWSNLYPLAFLSIIILLAAAKPA
ncbi:MAG: hypothetical protein QF872_07295, partial [Gammaproteobacteria bacterium]|nr:hypothetical protein [Gammaproteobacteria bacterium]